MSAAYDVWDDAEREQEQEQQDEATLQRRRAQEVELEALRVERERLRVLCDAYLDLSAGAPPAPRPARAGRGLSDRWADMYLRCLELHADWVLQYQTAIDLRSTKVYSRPQKAPGPRGAWGSREAGKPTTHVTRGNQESSGSRPEK